MDKLSRAEEITSEVRKLVLTCRSLEAQLQQSIPKKTHQEAMSKMQDTIDSITKDLDRTKAELESTTSIGQRIATLENQLASQTDTISSQSRTIDSLSAKLSETSVPFSFYTEALTKSKELESRISTMVDANDYDSVQRRCIELEEKIASMVPQARYEALEMEIANSVPAQKYEELQRSLEQMVPRDELSVAESRIAELERALADSVPRSDFEDLTGRIAQITKEAAELANRSSFSSLITTVETPTSFQETSDAISETPVTSFPEQAKAENVVENGSGTTAPTLEIVAQVSTEPPVAEASEVQTHPQEIAEVQSQLSEINSSMETGVTVVQSPKINTEKGFKFTNTEFCAKSGMEFLEDLEKVDISVVAAHCQNGDFERWFRDVLADEQSAESIRFIRESNVAGEELRSMMVTAIAPKYRS